MGENAPDGTEEIRRPFRTQNWFGRATSHFVAGQSVSINAVASRRGPMGRGLFDFWPRFDSVTGGAQPAPSPKPRQKSKILPPRRYIIGVNALISAVASRLLPFYPVPPAGCFHWARWQATWRPGATSRHAGTSVWQRGSAPGQRGWKGQPPGGRMGEGTSPARMMRRRLESGSTTGTAEINACG